MHKGRPRGSGGKHKTPHLSLEQQAEALRLYSENELTTEEIGIIFGKTPTCIRTLARKNGIKRNFDKRSYTLNEGKFSEPWTEEHSYWLGLLHADGHCSSGAYAVSLELKTEDGYLVRQFSEFIGSTRDLKIEDPHPFTNPQGRSYISTGTVRCSVSSKQLHRDLTDRGIVSKAKAIWMPPVGLRDYMRGIFDGNGSIIRSKRIGQWEWCYTGHQPACELFHRKFVEFGTTPRWRQKEGCIQIVVRNQPCIEKMHRFLYEGNTGPQMARKAIIPPSEHLWSSSGYTRPKKCCAEWDASRKRWRVRVQVDGRMVSLGRHKTRGLAMLAYAKHSLRAHGRYSPYYRIV